MTIKPITIAIDGPSGSGKSSVSKEVARRLELGYLDTGAMYRAATWWCLREGVELTDADSVTAVVDTMPLSMSTNPDDQTIRLDDVNITEIIRETNISSKVSAVATNLEVRDILRRMQRARIEAERTGGYSRGNGIVAEGRDITTVVAPDADVRILLVASEEARLARRAKDVHGVADAQAVEATKDEVLRRDADDSTVSSFQVAADGVATIDSSDLDFEQTVAAVLQVVENVTGN
ncbi:(d)CMP kinase [Timonella senegalensis]|uniref:(d)CMP kinase n=1 Tax=Timonella senegalensis TaxID=1465825 RepID=UPI002FDEAA65